MIRNNNMLYTFLRTAFVIAAAVGVVACTEDPATQNAGELPDQNIVPTGALYRVGATKADQTNVMIGADLTDKFVYRLSQAVPNDVTVTLDLADQADIDLYNDVNKLEDVRAADNHFIFHRYRMLPQKSYTLPEDMTLTVKAGQLESEPLQVKIIYDALFSGPEWSPNLICYLNYMLPLRVSSVSGVAPAQNKQVLHYLIQVSEKDNPEINFPPREKKKEYVCVAYVDLQTTMPQIVNEFGLELYVRRSNPFVNEEYMMFDIVNLLNATIKYDADAELPVLQPSTDLSYVLNHADRYLSAIHNHGIKICVTIKGGGDGIGFCNLNDVMRASFVWQVKNLVSTYGLDGVNLWDEKAAYDKAVAPMELDSYTKLLKDLREALPGKVIAVSDAGNSAAGLYDSHNGISAGTYIDYAWPAEQNKVVNPWNSTSTYKPIAGFTNKKHWGALYSVCEDTPEFKSIDEEGISDEIATDLRATECDRMTVVHMFPFTQGFIESNFFSSFDPMLRVCWPYSRTPGTWLSSLLTSSKKWGKPSSMDGLGGGNGYGSFTKDW